MPSRKLDGRIAVALVALAMTFAEAGCLRTKVHASAPATVPPQPEAERPMNVAPDTNALPPKPADTPAPAIATASSAPPLDAIAQPKGPSAPPKPAPGQPAASESTADSTAHPPVPLISPQISVADQQNYERKMNDDISTAEKNLQQANKRQLNAGQQDLVAKIRSFLDQSRDAGKDGDWARAENLAEKARILSAELVNTL